MLSLLVILVVIGAAVLVALWAGTLFLQNYYYTEPTEQLYWKAPAAAGVLFVFWLIWCLINANSAEARPDNIPYDTVFSLRAEESLAKEPPDYLWVETKKSKEPIRCKRYTDVIQGTTQYKYHEQKGDTKGPWPRDIVAIEIREKGEAFRFVPEQSERGDYQRFRSPDGWVLVGFEGGPSQPPTRFLWGRFLFIVILNTTHLSLWFVCLWLLLRFQWSHALSIGFVLWLVVTLAVMPMLLREAGSVAQEKSRPQTLGASAVSATAPL